MLVNFQELKEVFTQIYNSVKDNNKGKVADYIPQLAKVNPDLFGISICTVKGERFDIGDTNINFCMQSCTKPILYCIAQQLLGEKKIHEYVGHEPSGQRFNAFVLNENMRPHNPMINAGAIMTCSLIKPNEEPSERFEYVINFCKEMAGHSGELGFDNCVYLSEKETAHRNFALTHFMAEYKSFPKGTDLQKTLEFYFQCCSLLTNAQTMAVMASTLANFGKCPITEKQVIETSITKNCLSLMYTCGMYDYSGRFAFEIGLPGKSGVSGCLFLVVPDVMGVCIWSPPLDECGNSVRGVEVCHRLIQKYSFHIFDRYIEYQSEVSDNEVEDDTNSGESENLHAFMFITYASRGELSKMKELISKKKNLLDINTKDYDHRTALHLASAEGHLEIVEFLISEGVDKEIKDRWGNTAYHEAHKHIIENHKCEKDQNYENYEKICALLK